MKVLKISDQYQVKLIFRLRNPQRNLLCLTMDTVVLVYKPSSEKDSGPHENIRQLFEANLEDEGLELEHVHQSTVGVNFVKIHAPWEVLTRYAEIIKMKMLMKEPKASSHFWSSVVDSSRNSLSSIWPTANSSTFAQPLLNLDNANLNTTERDQEVFEESGFVEVPMPPSITSTLSTDSFNLFQTFDIWNPPLIASDISSPSSLDVWSNFSVFS
ncbi:uncharacterized protein LOC143230785 isoform X1 [Tachypleus tridentatus]|uniref:uncharacterized protein LOC143230785 isoform X1 n=1 Tax=Tachypleus tridentatus TaxID=6853 RepID=UPI003FD4CA9B